jgi:hypothetical protein
MINSIANDFLNGIGSVFPPEIKAVALVKLGVHVQPFPFGSSNPDSDFEIRKRD